MIIMAFALLVAPIAVPAQDMPMGKWWRSPKVIQDLSLSKEEIGRLDKEYLDNRKNMADLKAKVEKERIDLEKMMEAEKLDEAALMVQLKKLEAARSNLSQERFSFVVETRKILGIDRFKKLKTHYDMARDEMHRMREHMNDARKGPGQGLGPTPGSAKGFRPPAPPDDD